MGVPGGFSSFSPTVYSYTLFDCFFFFLPFIVREMGRRGKEQGSMASRMVTFTLELCVCVYVVLWIE